MNPRRPLTTRESGSVTLMRPSGVAGRPAASVHAVGGVKGVEVHRGNGVDDKPSQMTRRQPLTDVGRHQKRLLAITPDKALAHRRRLLKPPDRTPTYATASPRCDSPGPRRSAPRRAAADRPLR